MRLLLPVGSLALCLTTLPWNTALHAASDKKNSSGDYDTVELQGCLQRSEGRYILVDKDNTYERLSDTSKLRNLVSHEVKVTGKRAMRTVDTTPPGAASSAVEVRYIEVKTVSDISPSCQAYGR
jgi:hypothetical protein